MPSPSGAILWDAPRAINSIDQRKPSIAMVSEIFERIFLSRTREARRLRRSQILDKKILSKNGLPLRSTADHDEQ